MWEWPYIHFANVKKSASSQRLTSNLSYLLEAFFFISWFTVNYHTKVSFCFGIFSIFDIFLEENICQCKSEEALSRVEILLVL